VPEHRPVVEVVGGVPVVAVPEEIDMTNAGGLGTALLEAAGRGRGTFVADMSRTRFCDSAGIQALVRAHNRSQAEGGEMLLAVSAAAVLRVFALMGIDRLIRNFPTLHEALAQASAPGPPAQPRADGDAAGPGPVPPAGARPRHRGSTAYLRHDVITTGAARRFVM
jgi:anti-sigma B factor antagonist